MQLAKAKNPKILEVKKWHVVDDKGDLRLCDKYGFYDLHTISIYFGFYASMCIKVHFYDLKSDNLRAATQIFK